MTALERGRLHHRLRVLLRRVLLPLVGVGLGLGLVSAVLAASYTAGYRSGGSSHHGGADCSSHEGSSSQHDVLALSAGVCQHGFHFIGDLVRDAPAFDQYPARPLDRIAEWRRPEVLPDDEEHR